MVSLDQIKILEEKVQNAVAYITKLKQENSLLQKSLEKYRKRIDELEVLINEYKEDQNAIEEGIKNALLHLDKLEDFITKPPAGGKASTPVQPSGQGSAIEVEDIEGAAVSDSAAISDSAVEELAEEEPEKAPGELDIF
jgi:uncharacterized protein YlxW (UPF0749 family)